MYGSGSPMAGSYIGRRDVREHWIMSFLMCCPCRRLTSQMQQRSFSMYSSSLQKMAQVLISYCLEIQAGDILRIRTGTAALPLLYEVYRAALRAGVYILPLFQDSTLDEILLREGSTEQILYVSPGLQPEMEAITKWLDILCDTNNRQFTSIASERLALKQQAAQPMFRLFDQ